MDERTRPLGKLTDKTPWHVDGNNSRDVDGDNFFGHVDGNYFFACRRRQLFLHVDGDNFVWHVDVTETIFFACRRRQSCFGMSMGTTLLACQQFGMSTRRMPIFFPFRGLQQPISGVFILARWPCLTCASATVKNKYYTTELDMYV